MATYYVNSGAGGANTGGSWTNAFLTYAQGVTAAGSNGDIILVHYTHAEDLAADTAFTFTANVSTISVDKDTSDVPTQMTGYIGHATVHRQMNIAGARRTYFYGLRLQVAGTTSRDILLTNTDGQSSIYENCIFRFINNQPASDLFLTNSQNSFCYLLNCSLYITVAGQGMFMLGGKVLVEGLVITGAVAGPDVLLDAAGSAAVDGQTADFIGCDFSNMSGDTLVSDVITPTTVRFSQCKFGATTTVHEALTSVTNKGGLEVSVFDCSSGDTHGLFGYYNALGSVVSDTGIFLTSGAAAQSWKIVTTANCSFYTPFETPWLGYYNTVTTAITPYVEILRNLSATAYQNDEVWIDVMAKTTASSTASSRTTDRMTLLGSPANQDAGAGLGSWTGEDATAWSGKIGLTASITPAEVGHIQARIVVGEPSITVYADPQIRT